MNKTQQLNQIKERRRIRTRAKLFGTMERPRLSVLRTNQFTSVQLIDDMTGKTLASASTRDMSAKGGSASGGKEHRVANIITKKPIRAGNEEIKINPRARSAKLRVLQKI